MATLEKISAFAGKTFTVWVLIFAVIAYFLPQHFAWIGNYIVLYWELSCLAWG